MRFALFLILGFVGGPAALVALSYLWSHPGVLAWVAAGVVLPVVLAVVYGMMTSRGTSEAERETARLPADSERSFRPDGGVAHPNARGAPIDP